MRSTRSTLSTSMRASSTSTRGRRPTRSQPWGTARHLGPLFPDRGRHAHPAAWLTFVGALLFAIIFGSLGVKRQDTFGTWSFDMGIYDQGFWQVARWRADVHDRARAWTSGVNTST